MSEQIDEEIRLITLRDQLRSGGISVEDVDPEDLKCIRAEERRAARAVYANCDHVLEDVTEERRVFLEKQTLPSWAKALIEKEMEKPPGQRRERWLNRSEKWKSVRYLKCTICGLLKISDAPPLKAGLR